MAAEPGGVRRPASRPSLAAASAYLPLLPVEVSGVVEPVLPEPVVPEPVVPVLDPLPALPEPP